MINVGWLSTHESSSSGGFRNAILSQHDMLRGLLAEAVDLAAPRLMSRAELEALRERVRGVYVMLEDHLAFEEHAFPQALRDVIGWGPVLQAQIEESHARQRRALADAFRALEPGALSPAQLSCEVRALAAALLTDIDGEDDALLNADLDAIATDSEGG
ncbi:MAG TPA: hemerythrin domain-containing protein [Polyangia bacterium]|jgi:hypothetical protein|nr:hemerythrin domain-containing protein [Polyangia bacterium]